MQIKFLTFLQVEAVSYTHLDNEEIVLSDVIYLETGNQISADSIVLDTAVEVDESLLTGEVDPVLKRVGDHLLSGSFIVSGACHAEVEHVGIDNYATKIANEARNRKPVISEPVSYTHLLVEQF